MNEERIKILLVEDDKDDFLLFKNYLNKLDINHNLEWESSYEKGISRLKEKNDFSLCFIDYHLGAKNGIDFINEVRKNNLPQAIILLTGQGDEQLGVKAVRAGAEDYYNKSGINPETLDRAIRFTLERKRTREKDHQLLIAQREKRIFSAIFEKAPAFITILRGREYIFEMANPAYRQLVGRERDIIGKPVLEALPEVRDQGFIEMLDEVFKTGTPHIENEIKVLLQRTERGPLEERFLNFVYQPISEEDGTISGIFVHGVDVTDQVKARSSIESIAAELNAVIESMPDGVLIADKGKIRKVNKKAAEIFGFGTEETMLTQFSDYNKTFNFTDPTTGKKYRNSHSSLAQAALGQGSTYDAHITIPRTKEQKYIHVAAAPITINSNITGSVAIVSDITAERKSAEQLRDSNNTLDAIISFSPLPIYVLDTKGKVIIWNKASERIFGWCAEEVVGKQLPIVQQTKKEEYKKLFSSLMRGETFVKDLVRRRKDGKEVHVNIAATPLFDEKGKVKSIVAVTADITARKELEKQKDEFLGIASHELKTPVTSLKGFTQVMQLLAKRKGDTRAYEMLSKMDGQLNKLTDLIGDLLDVTKIQAGRLAFNPSYFQFDDLIEETVESMQLTTEKHELVLNGTTNKKVYGDRERIGQVLTNLISNAIKYSPHTKKIIVKTALKQDKVEVCVQDFGIGIPDDKRERVFEQFFRVSGPHTNTFPGLGLGLYISSEIIKRLGGRIWVESSQGNSVKQTKTGSTFCFSLPIKKRKLDDHVRELSREEVSHL